MKKIISILLFIFIINVILAQPSIVIPTSSVHQRLTLNKGWRFHKGDIPFPEIKGQEMSYDNAKAGTSWGAAAPNYDDSDWRLLNLPHDWAVEGGFNPNVNIAQGYRERGIGWYRRTFKLLDEDKGKHIELQFDGIATYATIWVNGTILHRNFCGYTSMYIDITPYANYGDNTNIIAVRVDADTQEGWWYEGAGMYRNSWLVKRSPLHIITDGVYANPVKTDNNNWDISVEVTLNNIAEAPVNADIEVSVLDAAGKLIVSGKQSATVGVFQNIPVRLTLQVDNPTLWELDKPVLYTVKTNVKTKGIVQDQSIIKCGFRTIRFDSKKGFFLNDKNIKIKGV